MIRVYSKYSVWGGFGFKVFISCAPLIIFILAYMQGRPIFDLNRTQTLCIALVFLFTIYDFTKSCKRIIADKKGIIFINPLFPFLKKAYTWRDFDYSILVMEYRQRYYYEAVWLIKDGRVKARFSSLYYSNYPALKKQIKCNRRPRKKNFLLKQICVWWRLHRLKV